MAKELTVERALKMRAGIRLARRPSGQNADIAARHSWLAYLTYVEVIERRERRQRAGQW